MISNCPHHFRNIFREVVSSVKVILKNNDNNNSDDEMTMMMITKQNTNLNDNARFIKLNSKHSHYNVCSSLSKLFNWIQRIYLIVENHFHCCMTLEGKKSLVLIKRFCVFPSFQETKWKTYVSKPMLK